MILLDQAGAGEVCSAIFPPDPGLKGFVEHYWVQYSPAPEACRTPWRIVPDASPHIIVSVARELRRLEDIRVSVVGARSRFVDVSLANRSLTLGFRLVPGTLPLLTRLPASDFADCAVSMEDSLGIQGKVLTDRLVHQQSAAQVLNVLSEFLRQRFRNERPPCRIGAHVGRVDRVEELACTLGVPSRTLYARTKEQVGLTPKRLLRVQRLHRALVIRHERPTPWAHVAAMCGFADQAHLVREFHELLGEAPGAWQERALAVEVSSATGASPNRQPIF